MPEPTEKKRKLNKAKKTLIINAAGNGTAGNWRHPDDISYKFGYDLDTWIEYAKLAERGKLNGIFIADHLSIFSGYKGDENYEAPAKSGVNFARIEPGALVTGITSHTKNISVGVTFSTVAEPPFHFARRLATLDNLSKGRVGWNIVSSYLSGIAKQLLNGEPFPEHDDRYKRTTEYFEVVTKLLLSSWRDDALVIDRERDVFIDPERIRQINHEGDHFKVLGPSNFQPSPQRLPLLIQAGTSEKGKLFAAESAEVVFVGAENTEKLAKDIKDIKKLAQEKFNRNPDHIKFVIAANVITGKTDEEVAAKKARYEQYGSLFSKEVSFSAVTGIDLSKYELDEPVVLKQNSNALRSTVDSHIPGLKPRTKREILETYQKYNMFGHTFVGTPSQIADELERWIDEYDIDGLNLGFGAPYPSNLEEIVDLLIPELQDRELFWKDYPVQGGTFRENAFGVKGQSFVHDDHPVHKLRWTEKVSKTQFEKDLKQHYELLERQRAD